MKRYRILQFDFDTRARFLSEAIQDSWEEPVKQTHRHNKRITREELLFSYGVLNHEDKIQNFIDLGDKPFSILAFHNRFFEESRSAFVIGSYYPCLTAVCALGERILNHLIILLRDDFIGSDEYKRVYNKESFDNWLLPIETLSAWGVLLPEVKELYENLMEMRNKAIHFRPETDANPRLLALEAYQCLQDIISRQFSATDQPWIFWTSGEVYIRKEWEDQPFIKKVYIPNCKLVGPLNRVVSMRPKLVIDDNYPYSNNEITDEQFKDFSIGKRLPEEYTAK